MGEMIHLTWNVFPHYVVSKDLHVTSLLNKQISLALWPPFTDESHEMIDIWRTLKELTVCPTVPNLASVWYHRVPIVENPVTGTIRKLLLNEITLYLIPKTYCVCWISSAGDVYFPPLLLVSSKDSLQDSTKWFFFYMLMDKLDKSKANFCYL